MRKLLKFLSILILGILCSACVNTFAVNELNKLAVEHIESGDMDGAIARLESSVDLDPKIYESRYNLAIAYMNKGKCDKAREQMEVAITLIKNEPAAYYTLGATQTCSADKIFSKVNENGEEITEHFEPAVQEKKEKQYFEMITKANENFEMYAKLAPNVENINDVYAQIERNKSKIAPLMKKYGKKDDGTNN